MKLMNIVLIVLLSAALFALPAFAQDTNLNTGTLIVPIVDGETNVTADKVYVTGPKEPGVFITASDKDAAVTVSGNVDAVYGGVDLSAENGHQVTLQTGGIRGGFGVLANINGGQVTGNVDSVTASSDAALEAVLSDSGSLQFTANTISSSADAVVVETGVNFTDPNFITDEEQYQEPGDPGSDDWDVISDESESTETASAGKYIADSSPEGKSEIIAEPALGSSFSGSAVQKDGGSTDVVITAGSIDAGSTAVDLTLSDDRKIKLESDEIISEGTGVQIDLSRLGGDVTLTSPIIDADEQGVVINAPSGTVTVEAVDYIYGRSAAEVFNYGGDIKLDAGYIFGRSGLYIESTSGKTVENTKDIAIENYGIYVHTHDAVEEQPFDPAGETTEPSDPEENAGSPDVTVTVDGDITDAFVFPEEPFEEIELLPEPDEPEMAKKAAEDEEEDESEEVSTGIIIEAETAGKTEITVNGEVYTAYGNEISAENDAEVNVSVQDDVTTTYGNRLGADDAKVEFSVGGNINAGGKALDTLASGSGELTVIVGKDIIVNDSGNEEEASGICANSMENGSTTIDVKGGISVLPKNDDTTGSGIYAENTGGEITITVGKDVTAEGSDSAGAVIINDSESDFSEAGEDAEPSSVKTTIEIMGDLTGKTTGLYVDGSGSSLASVFVEGTISGDDAGVEISDETSADNVDLTAWKITLKDGKAVTGSAKAAAVEDNTKYLIKYAPDDLEGRVKAVNENGGPLPDAHGYQYAKNGEKVYFRSVDGDVEAIYNGKERKTALTKEVDGSFSLVIPAGGGVWISSDPDPEPEPAEPPHHMDFYRIGDLSWLYDRELPHTGFSASHVTPLAARPQDLSYRRTGLTLQIPSLDVAEDIVTVPQSDGSYPVEWLGSSVGFLEESSLPGAGITVLTGHNHLNTKEAGPFLFIKTLEAGDAVMVTKKDGSMLLYRVYGSYKIAPDAFASVSGELRQNSLVLITCEDEAVDGGYTSRRVVLAAPVG